MFLSSPIFSNLGSYYQPSDCTGQFDILDRDIEYAKVHTQVGYFESNMLWFLTKCDRVILIIFFFLKQYLVRLYFVDFYTSILIGQISWLFRVQRQLKVLRFKNRCPSKLLKEKLNKSLLRRLIMLNLFQFQLTWIILGTLNIIGILTFYTKAWNETNYRITKHDLFAK